MHHIISDGWSSAILANDVLAYYEFYQFGKTLNLQELRIQYKDYASWQIDELNKEDSKKHQRYWIDKLSGNLPRLNLPNQKKRPKVKSNNGELLGTFISPEISMKLKKFNSEHGGSLFISILTTVNILLSRYTNQKTSGEL